MIIAIRDKLFKNRNVITYLILGVLAIAFLIPGIAKRTSLYGDWMYRVNGQDIGYHDYLRKVTFFEQYITAIRHHYGQYAEMFLRMMGLSADVHELAAKAVIDEELMNQAARQLNLHFDDAFVDSHLDDMQFIQQTMPDLIPPFVFDETGRISDMQLHAYLKRMRISNETFKSRVHEAFARLILARLIASSVYIPDSEVREYFAQHNQGRKYSIITIPFERILREEKAKELSQEDVKNYFQQVKERYTLPEKRSGFSWTFGPENYDIKVTSGDIERYYDEFKTSRFVDSPAQVEVRRILIASNEEDGEDKVKLASKIHAQVKQDPSLFAAKATEFSDDKETAKKGGLMKPFAKGVHNKVVERAAFLLEKDGDISEIIKTDKGFEILQRVSKKQAVFKPIDKVRAEIISTLTKQKFGAAVTEDLKRILRSDEATIKQFIAEKNGIERKIEPVAKSPHDKVAQALFSLEKGEYTFYLDGDKAVIVNLATIKPKNLPEFQTVEKAVTNDLYEHRAQERMARLLQEAHAAISAKTPFEKIALDVKGNLIRTGFLKQSEPETLSELNEKKLPTKDILAVEKAGLATTKEVQRDGYIIRCDDVEPLDMQTYVARKSALHKDIQKERHSIMTNGFVASLYRVAKIEANKVPVNE